MKAPARDIVTVRMFDTRAIARSLTAADLTPTQADAITDAVCLAAEHDASGVDVDTLATKADVAALQTDVAALEERMTHFATKEDLAALEARLAWRLVGAGSAIAGIQAAALFALLRLVD